MRQEIDPETKRPPAEPFISRYRAAARVGVGADWLKREALAGRMPHLLFGKIMKFRVSDVNDELVRRARATVSRLTGEDPDRREKARR